MQEYIRKARDGLHQSIPSPKEWEQEHKPQSTAKSRTWAGRDERWKRHSTARLSTSHREKETTMPQGHQGEPPSASGTKASFTEFSLLSLEHTERKETWMLLPRNSECLRRELRACEVGEGGNLPKRVLWMFTEGISLKGTTGRWWPKRQRLKRTASYRLLAPWLEGLTEALDNRSGSNDSSKHQCEPSVGASWTLFWETLI